MRAYPHAKFILTTRASCDEWLESMRRLWSSAKARGGFSPGYKSFHRCVFGSNELNNATQAGYLHRCREHATSVTAHAAGWQIPLLVLPLEWDSSRKWGALGDFLGLNTSLLAQTPWPHRLD